MGHYPAYIILLTKRTIHSCLLFYTGPGWGQWGSWSDCSRTCGYGRHYRFRSCYDANLGGNGIVCDGSYSDYKGCDGVPANCPGQFTLMTYQIRILDNTVA